MNKFVLKFIWLEKSIAVALDQKIEEQTSPITEYFFWPRKNAWEELKMEIDSKPWISQYESNTLLNKATEVIVHWQKEKENKTGRKSIQKIREQFPECIFFGHD
jgi:30S ribosomal protein 3